jgi:hypothetical protein
MVSLLVVMQTGEAIETGIIGAEGLLGGDAPINGHLSTQATVQLDGAAVTMPKAQFIEAYHAHPHLRNLVNRYQSILLMQARQNAACHALHSVCGRLCRWLLQSQDRKRHVRPDPRVSFAHARRAPKHRFGRGPCPAASRADPVCARAHHHPRPRRTRGLRLRMLFGDPRGD